MCAGTRCQQVLARSPQRSGTVAGRQASENRDERILLPVNVHVQAITGYEIVTWTSRLDKPDDHTFQHQICQGQTVRYSFNGRPVIQTYRAAWKLFVWFHSQRNVNATALPSHHTGTSYLTCLPACTQLSIVCRFCLNLSLYCEVDCL